MKALVLGSFLLASTVCAGKEVGNGGFLYSRTSLKLLEASKESLLKDVSQLLRQREGRRYTSPVCSKEIDFRSLENSISNLTYDFDAESMAINPNGEREKRYFHINAENNVEATELYFSSFVDTYFRYIEADSEARREKISFPVRKAIVHEALHLFDYNEMAARACSSELLRVIESYNDEKLDIAIDETTKRNDLAVKSFLDKKCGWIEAEAKRSIDRILAIQVYQCIVVNGEPEWEKKPYSTSKATKDIERTLFSMDALVKRVNEIFKFSFEEEVPFKK